MPVFTVMGECVMDLMVHAQHMLHVGCRLAAFAQYAAAELLSRGRIVLQQSR